MMQIKRDKRLGSMFLDHVAMSFIMMLFLIPEIIRQISTMNSSEHDIGFYKIKYWSLIGVALYLCKDCINGRSIAKRTTKLQVVDNATGTVASPLQCFVRNIFIIVWPIEVIVSLFNTERRIGDRVAGTRLVPYDPSIAQPKTKVNQLILPLLLGFGISSLCLIPFNKALNMKSKAVDPIISSYNQKESAELENIYNQSLSGYLIPEAKVYNKIKDDSLKYISINFNLKNDYNFQSTPFNELKTATLQLLYSMYPDSAFVGRLNYNFRTEGVVHSMVIMMDKRKLAHNSSR